MQSYILYALAAMLLYSISPILHKTIPKLSTPHLILIYSIVGTVLASIILIAHPNKAANTQITKTGIILAVATGLLINAAFLLYIKALRTGPTSIAVILKNMSIPLTIILAIFLLKEQITLTKAAGIVLGIISIILVLI